MDYLQGPSPLFVSSVTGTTNLLLRPLSPSRHILQQLLLLYCPSLPHHPQLSVILLPLDLP